MAGTGKAHLRSCPITYPTRSSGGVVRLLDSPITTVNSVFPRTVPRCAIPLSSTSSYLPRTRTAHRDDLRSRYYRPFATRHPALLTSLRVASHNTTPSPFASAHVCDATPGSPDQLPRIFAQHNTQSIPIGARRGSPPSLLTCTLLSSQRRYSNPSTTRALPRHAPGTLLSSHRRYSQPEYYTCTAATRPRP